MEQITPEEQELLDARQEILDAIKDLEDRGLVEQVEGRWYAKRIKGEKGTEIEDSD